MTTISADVIADSVSESGVRITTLALKYPRFIHAEVMTHRVFSRNASSSRAKPVQRMIDEILADTAMPLVWTKNQPGMQGYEAWDQNINIDDGDHDWYRFHGNKEAAWREARDFAIKIARGFHNAEYHKQVVNRLLEPFMHIDVLVTATEWTNFMALRDHEAAEPHIQILAREIKKARDASTPKLLKRDEWHLPYVIDGEDDLLTLEQKLMVSVARCSRVSYSNHEGKISTLAEDHAQYERLLGASPIHASPAEHQATPDIILAGKRWMQPWFHGNFVGWKQYRKSLPNENILDADVDFGVK